MEEENTAGLVTLIYYNFRGMAQNIRYVLLYLNIPFNEILLNNGQDPASLEILKKLNFNGEYQLPCLVDGKIIIQNCFAMIRYLCAKAKRQDLLGSKIQERAIIREIYYTFMHKKKKTIQILFKFGQQAATNPTKKQQIRKQAMEYIHKESGSIVPCIRLKLRNPNGKYIFDHLTVLDFLLYEQSFYQVYLFGSLEEKNCKIFDTINSIFGTDFCNIKDKGLLYLRAMRQFKQNFEKQPFYLENKEKIESYTVISLSMNGFCKQAFKNVWLGPEKYVK